MSQVGPDREKLGPLAIRQGTFIASNQEQNMPVHLISRRRFLRQVAAGGAALALARPGLARADADGVVHWALVADSHVAADPEVVHWGGNMSERLARVVQDILDHDPRPTAVQINGDLALHRGEAGDYTQFFKLLEPLRKADVDIHLTLGNHDDRDNFLTEAQQMRHAGELVEGRHISLVDAGPARLGMLDSLIRPNHTPGELGDAQRAWLAKVLDAHRDKPVLLFVHHDLSPAGSALQDTAALMGLITPRRQVKAVFQGHNHVYATFQAQPDDKDVTVALERGDLRDGSGAKDVLHLVKTPATGYAFSENQPVGWLHAKMSAKGIRLKLRAIDGHRALHDTRRDLAWRA